MLLSHRETLPSLATAVFGMLSWSCSFSCVRPCRLRQDPSISFFCQDPATSENRSAAPNGRKCCMHTLAVRTYVCCVFSDGTYSISLLTPQLPRPLFSVFLSLLLLPRGRTLLPCLADADLGVPSSRGVEGGVLPAPQPHRRPDLGHARAHVPRLHDGVRAAGRPQGVAGQDPERDPPHRVLRRAQGERASDS